VDGRNDPYVPAVSAGHLGSSGGRGRWVLRASNAMYSVRAMGVGRDFFGYLSCSLNHLGRFDSSFSDLGCGTSEAAGILQNCALSCAETSAIDALPRRSAMARS
jgi:hypothetical protein